MQIYILTVSREEWDFSIVSITMLNYGENVGRENFNFTGPKNKSLLQLLWPLRYIILIQPYYYCL